MDNLKLTTSPIKRNQAIPIPDEVSMTTPDPEYHRQHSPGTQDPPSLTPPSKRLMSKSFDYPYGGPMTAVELHTRVLRSRSTLFKFMTVPKDPPLFNSREDEVNILNRYQEKLPLVWPTGRILITIGRKLPPLVLLEALDRRDRFQSSRNHVPTLK